MRKYLGVLAGIALLCAISWAQTPAPTPAPDSAQAPAAPSQAPTPDAPPAQTPNAPGAQTPNPPSTSASGQTSPEPEPATIPLPASKRAAPTYPHTELFVGYSFAQAGFFNAGHWAQLNGWNVSFALNAANWIGLLIDGSEFFGNSQIPTGTPAPFPPCGPFCPQTFPTFNANTREFNILFGAQFPYRKRQRWTPFGELLFGHDGVRGTASAAPPAGYFAEVSSGLALVAGAGVDHKISERFALRVKADYLQTRTDFPSLNKNKQDNLRLSVGLVIRSVHKKKRRLEDETEPEP